MEQSRACDRIVRYVNRSARPDERGKVSCKGTRQMTDLVAVKENGNGVRVMVRCPVPSTP